ncbi:MAG TPA: ABC transporter substrate-binding protein [Acidimicrobiales bacterium]|nr:ABC transporter substrate-binding protein [Acidimicrobiales bacterium]
MRRQSAAGKVGGALGAVALLVAACSSPTTSAPPVSSGSSPTHSIGGSASWAEPPGSVPTDIFPFMSLTDDSAANVLQLQDLLYRPLYWFGQGATPALNRSLSLARPPVFSNGDQTVTITLNHYRWSDGEPVDATDVMFWMNMMHADKANWAEYAPGAFPDNIKTITVDSADQLTFQLTGAYNPDWFTGNELSQITPLPVAWDITQAGAAPGSGGCSAAAYGSADGACNAVYSFLSGQAGESAAGAGTANPALSGYGASRLWRVVDGPWQLVSIDGSGHVAFKANPKYSGPVKPSVSSFVEVPFATSADEFTGLVDRTVDVGYLPQSEVPAAKKGGGPSGNNSRLADFRLSPLYRWSLQYIPYNFSSTGDGAMTGKIFSQLYVRQALQLLVDQPGIIKTVLKGYGVPTYGPVPLEPANPFVSKAAKDNPYPYDPARAIRLLTSNGWKVAPGQVSHCVNPGTGAGQCGTGIALGASLNFTLQYASDVPWTAAVLTAEKASWARAGIEVDLTPAAGTTVSSNATPCAGGLSCSWELEDWGTGWSFAPETYPSGEALFGTGSGSNAGSYSDFIANELMAQTEHGAGDLSGYQNYLAKQLPVVFEPSPASSLTEVSSTLRGVTPQNVLGALTPETWYFVH